MSVIPAAPPQVQLLSNGSYHVMLTSAGAGYSRWKKLAVTRWREDATCDNWGSFCYVRDLAGGDVWSNSRRPALRQADSDEATFLPGVASFQRSVDDIQMQTEIVVSPQDDVEVRRIRLTNRCSARRLLAVTSYAEIVLATAATDAAHQAFSKLFVETEIVPEQQAILCSRRPRAPDEPTPWLFHLLNPSQPPGEEVSFETDRMRFIGRGRSTADPQALDEDGPLSGSAGAVLDAVAAIRCAIALEPGATVSVDLITGVCGSRDECLRLMAKYRDQAMADRALAAAPARAKQVLATLKASEADAGLYARLAGCVIYANAALRATPDILASNLQGQQSLWAYGVSGDLPIVLLRIADAARIELVSQLVQAHAWWRLNGLAADLVILCEGDAGRQRALKQQAVELITVGGGAEHIDKPGGIFVRLAEKLPQTDTVLLQTVARVVLNGAAGSLARQLDRLASMSIATSSSSPPDAVPVADHGKRAAARPVTEAAPRDLLFDNGTGGFSADGREYVITTEAGRMTPLPWVNVVANPGFGTLVSESGSATTWSENAQAFRLTPWSNDPVGDPNTEAFYIRDEDSGHSWSPTLLPCGGSAPYVTRHGFGYSVFEHDENDIGSELVVYVARDAPVKFVQLTLRNASGRARRLSVTGYLQWVLGDEPAKTRMFVSTEIDAASGALFARNPYNTAFAGQVAFFAADESAGISHCGDRAAFLGPGGTLRSPAAMSKARLCGTVGASLDPCAAIRVPVDLAPGQARDVGFRLGAASSAKEARDLVQRWRGPAAAGAALTGVKEYWQHTLGALQVQTPDRSLNVLANGWLVYQVLACRLWARTAFYQSSGAYGFRDQLQDVMALVHVTPASVREHLLRSAARQFPEGDVQHWWHPPLGGGVRTRCSDDYLWLPLATCRYVAVTGDSAVLDEPVHFLQGRALEAGKESAYDQQPGTAEAVASLYQHCVRAIEHGLRFGEHGLPLMGSGDWSDGMNLVGAAGKGESVWLAFFLCTVLAQFETVARQRGDGDFAGRCAHESVRLRAAIEQHAWDGAWYRRAWFDDGSPLGTAGNAECRIDSIAQSWAVLSGAADARRARSAMDAVDAQLVRRDAALIQLLDPPFEHSNPSPGYVQGYVRGVRENGGQYTHAAVWVAMAFAALGDAERAWEMFTLLDPTRHTITPDAVACYKTEPYVMAGDVYALAPHAGRGGWSWYTGAAGWMLQFILESLLGLKVEADQLQMAPCIPAHWKSFQLHYRYRRTPYHITVTQTPGMDGFGGLAGLTLDGAALPGPVIHLLDDGREHRVGVEWRGPMLVQHRPAPEKDCP